MCLCSCVWPSADVCRCLIKDSRDESPPKTSASDTNPAGRWRRDRGRESDDRKKEEDMKIVGKTNVGGMRTECKKAPE